MDSYTNYTNDYLLEKDVERFDKYQQYLPSLTPSPDFGVRFPHSHSIILVIDEFDQLPLQTAADLIRISCSPFLSLFGGFREQIRFYGYCYEEQHHK